MALILLAGTFISIFSITYGITKLFFYFRHRKTIKYLIEAREEFCQRLNHKPDLLDEIISRMETDLNNGVKHNEVLKRHFWH